MDTRETHLKNLAYEDDMAPDYDVFQEALETIFSPLVIDDISDMDNPDATVFLVAINNQGFFSEEVRISDNAIMHNFDQQLEEKDIYFLDITISNIKPFVFKTYLKYPKKTKDVLKTKEMPFLKRQHHIEEKFKAFVDMFNLEILTHKEVYENDKDFYNQYFDNTL